MFRFKTLQILCNIMKFATETKQASRNFRLFWFWYVQRNYITFGKKSARLIPVPVLYQLGFLLKSSKEDPLGERLRSADKLYNDVKYEEAGSLLTTLMNESTTDNDEILWRLARVKYEFSKIVPKEEKPKLLQEVLELLNRALSVNPQNGYVHKWLAIALDSLSSTKGIRERIDLAIQVRSHLLEALKYIPNDATTYYILGVWYFTIADFTWYEKKIASTINSKFPSTTYAEALQYFKQAEVVDPDFYSRNYLFLGKCYMRLKDNEMATEFLLKARDYPQKTLEDKETYTEAVNLLKKLGVN